MLIQQRNTLRTEPLNLQQFQRRRGIERQHLVAPLERPALAYFRQHCRKSFSYSWNVGHLTIGIADNVGDALRMTGDYARRIAVTANTKAVLRRDFHQVRRLLKQARDFLVFHNRG